MYLILGWTWLLFSTFVVIPLRREPGVNVLHSSFCLALLIDRLLFRLCWTRNVHQHPTTCIEFLRKSDMSSIVNCAFLPIDERIAMSSSAGSCVLLDLT